MFRNLCTLVLVFSLSSSLYAINARQSTFLNALMQSDWKLAKTKLAKNINVNFVGLSSGLSPLMVAAASGRVDILNKLIDKGLSLENAQLVNTPTNKDGLDWTALVMAIIPGYYNFAYKLASEWPVLIDHITIQAYPYQGLAKGQAYSIGDLIKRFKPMPGNEKAYKNMIGLYKKYHPHFQA